VIKLAIIALFVYFGWKAWHAVLGDRPRPRVAERKPVRQLVHDPQCNTYVPEQSAERVMVRGEMVYFCSPECRKAYLKRIEGETTA